MMHISALAAYIAWSISDKMKILCKTRCSLIVINNTYLRILENSMHQLSSKDGFLGLDFFRCLFLVSSCRSLLKFCKNRGQVYLTVLIRSVTIDFSRNKTLSSVEFYFYSSSWNLKLSLPKKYTDKGQILMSQQEDVKN